MNKSVLPVNSETSTLPRLLYVGDVPVESSYHGSALLYRLLQEYPPDKLFVVEAEPGLSRPERRLMDIPYRQFRMPATRWRNTRLSRIVGSLLTFTNSSHRTGRLREICDEFEPEAVLTVAHDYSWLSAALLAEECDLPLHLIVHDHWPSIVSVFPWLRSKLERQFGKIYRQAASRLCVSPFMEEEYRQNYGVAGQVLYPSRSKDCRSFDEMPMTYAKRTGALVGAFAGNISHGGYARLMATLAQCLEKRGGKLLLFGPQSNESLKVLGLDRPNIVPQGLVRPDDLIARLRDEADFVFVPMVFDSDGSEHNMRLSFPSKLTDYTATGLPMLICGPEYCSAVRWARHHGSVAELVTSPAIEAIDAALCRLEDAEHRIRLGQRARDLGSHFFSYRRSVEILRDSLRKPKPGDAISGRLTAKARGSL